MEEGAEHEQLDRQWLCHRYAPASTRCHGTGRKSDILGLVTGNLHLFLIPLGFEDVYKVPKYY